MKTMIGTNQSAEQLRSLVLRIEKLEADKTDIAADIKDVYAEAAGNGYDKGAIRGIVKLRKMDAHKAEEQETIFDTYRRALGMLPALESEEDAA